MFYQFFMAFILPILLVVTLAGIFGFLLVFLGRKLEVKRDERIDKTVCLLAGANCGGCGYPGCDAFAEALVSGKANLTACNPTSKEAKTEIAKILGLDADTEEETVAVVKCHGGTRAADKYTYVGYNNCVAAEVLSNGTKKCLTGCMGLGSCKGVCPYGAIDITDDRYAKVNDFLCTSCGACIKECPKNLIERIPVSAKVYVACSNKCKGRQVTDACSVGCIACGICAKTCKYGAITIADNLAVIDYKKCTGCQECVKKCPKKVILVKDKTVAEVNAAVKAKKEQECAVV